MEPSPCFALIERRRNNLEEFIPLIGNLGFPIAVSIYLLVRIEGKLENLTISIRELSEAIGKMS
jgi:hypothetical protein